MKPRRQFFATVLFVAAAASVTLHPQDAARPIWKSISVVPSASGESGKRALVANTPGQFAAKNVTVRELIQSAFERQAFDCREISGAPAWIDSDHFDITAVADRDYGQGLILQTLLAERFKLKLHTESRELPMHALRMTRSDRAIGPKLLKSNVDCAALMERFRRGERPAPEPGKGPPCSFSLHKGRLTATAVTMAELASVLSGHLDLRVVDRTELAGRFDLDLVAAEIPAKGPPGPSYRPPESSPSIFTALPEQLGLTLESTKEPVDVLVIDRVERPTPN